MSLITDRLVLRIKCQQHFKLFRKSYLLSKVLFGGICFYINRKFGSPVIIPMVALSAYVDTLEKQLVERWNQYKETNQASKLKA